jgi:hypothetical protein
MYRRHSLGNNSRQFAEMMEMHRMQQVVAKNSARGALSFDSSPPVISRQLKSPFSLPRSAADIVGATQADDDFERDSFASQSSRTTACIHFQEKFGKVATIYKGKCPPEEINERIREITFNAMAKSVVYEDIDPADSAFGGFKKTTVRVVYII